MLVVIAVLITLVAKSEAVETSAVEKATKSSKDWSTLITASELHRRLKNPDLVLIDARSPSEYESGHLPGAINVPGANWRTPPAKPGSGEIGQRIFRKADKTIDVERYEKLLSDAGISENNDVVVYGNYAGKADGSIPAAILLKLGHKRVAFLDGIGVNEWKSAGYAIENKPIERPATEYHASPDAKRLWNYEDVLANLHNSGVVIVDSRTPEEFAGKDLRGNKRGGHIPGAVLLDAEEFLDPKTHKTIAADEARKRIEAAVPKDKTVVIYCQSGTRCSHKELMLKDLGYDNVVLYDASWQEWGNREDAPVEEPRASEQSQKVVPAK